MGISGKFSIVAVVLLLLAPAPQAEAQSLFQLLFGGGGRLYQRPEAPAQPRYKPRAKRKAVAKIASPTYHDYKPDPLVKMDFPEFRGNLLAKPQLAGLEPMLAGASFREALLNMRDFDLLAEREVAKALEDYYASDPDFIWVSGLDPNGRAIEVVRTLDEAGSFGLNAADYSVALPRKNRSLENTGSRLVELMRFELMLSARVLRYVRDAEGARIDPNRMSGYYDFPPKTLDLVATLRALSHTSEARTYLESRHPQNAQYQSLRAELEALRAGAGDTVAIDRDLRLKPGQISSDLPMVLAAIGRELGEGSDFAEVLSRHGASELYDEELVPAIRAMQEKAGLKPDGIIGPRTMAALIGDPKTDRLDKVVIALEQMRWLPSDLGSPRVFINQPAFTASFLEGEQTRLITRAVIGKPSNQTSFFYDEVEQVDYNPYWGVPQSILVNEMLPRLRRDPGYLDRAGYEVLNANGRRIPSASVSWWAYGSKIPYTVRQVPSEANALGELKILFPNKHAIYMHDTPAKELFEQDVRAFSHGCIRLQDPRGMAAAVLGTSVDHIAEQLKHGHSSEMVTRKIPVYVAYFTAWPDDAGKVHYYSDIYGRDARLKAAIEKTDQVRAPDA